MEKVHRSSGTVCRFVDFGRDFSFFVENPDDTIQRHHYGGRLYEREELQIIARHAEVAEIIYDIGCNVGNHAIFMSKVLQPKKILVFEPNPSAIAILKINIGINAVTNIDTSYLGIGMGDLPGSFSVHAPLGNLGGATLWKASADKAAGRPADAKVVPVLALDSLATVPGPNFVKIDVEGMEMAVLRGMDALVQTHHPIIFIEVDNKNRDEFDAWLGPSKYAVIDKFKRSRANENFLIKYVPA